MITNIFKFSFLVFFIVLATSSCRIESKKKEVQVSTEKTELILYGSNSCDHCIEFKARLDSLKIAYTFKDVEQDEALAKEMLDAVHSVNYYDYIEFPVVKYGRYVLVNPDIDAVLNFR